ncbi:MAG: hypothetical protein J6Z49_05700 [Kiritimatiellae bacterium]|nr:hypothetical protein [Kiritimatiellia bacterium]
MQQNRDFNPDLFDSPVERRTPFRVSFLAFVVFLVPALLAVLLFAGIHFLSPRRPAAGLPSLPPPPASTLEERERLRQAGVGTEGIDLRFWVEQANAPALLFRVAPPVTNGLETAAWEWTFAQDARYVVACGPGVDAGGSRPAGLYDLINETWVWRARLPWPSRHERPLVVDGRLFLAYRRNGRRFMLRVSSDGEIAGIDTLESGRAGVENVPVPVGEEKRFVLDNIRFSVSPADGALEGRAALPFPGYRSEPPVLRAFNRPRPYLDETVVRGYAAVFSNLERAERQEPRPAPYLALRAQLCVANQAWRFAAAYMGTILERQQDDHRAPRVNPLLYARCLHLAGRNETAAAVCREGLAMLEEDQAPYNDRARSDFHVLLNVLESEGVK